MEAIREKWFNFFTAWDNGDYEPTSGNTLMDLINDFCNYNARSYEEYMTLQALLTDGMED